MAREDLPPARPRRGRPGKMDKNRADETGATGDSLTGKPTPDHAYDSIAARLEKQTLLAAIATRFIALPNEEIEAAVADTLAAIGRFAGADRACLSLYDERHERWSINHEWYREHLFPLCGLLEHLAPFRWSFGRMSAGEVISVQRPEEFPKEAANEALLLRGLGLGAHYQIPVRLGDRLIGFAALATTEPRSEPWPESFRALLELPGRMMAHALDHKAADAKLHENLSRWNSLCESNVVGVFVMRRSDGAVIESNEAGLRILGRRPEELAGGGIAWEDTTPEEDREQDQRMLAILERTGRVLPFEKHALQPDGTRVPILVTLTALAATSDELLSVAIDLRSRRRVEEELRRRDEIDRLHSELSRRLIDLPTASIDEAVREAMGSLARSFDFDAVTLYDVDEDAQHAIRRSYWRGDPPLPPMIAEDTLPLGRRPWWRERLRAGRTTAIAARSALPPAARLEQEALHAIGVEAVVSIPLTPGGSLRGILVFVATHPLTIADDQLAVMRVFGDIVANAMERRRIDAEIVEAVATLERRVSQRRTQLEASNAELEAFAYSVSHDLRAPLRTIDGMSQVLREDFAAELGPDAIALLERIQAATRRMGHLIDGLLQLSRVVRTEMEWKDVDLSLLAEDVVDEIRRHQGERVVEVTIESGLQVRGHPRLLRVALEQLFDNAFKFTRGRSVGHVALRRSTGGEADVISIADDGVGFDPGFAEQLFAAFQRLHGVEEFEGHGIGLATVDRIVRMHGGRAWAEGRPGEGATIFFALPAEGGGAA